MEVYIPYMDLDGMGMSTNDFFILPVAWAIWLGEFWQLSTESHWSKNTGNTYFARGGLARYPSFLNGSLFTILGEGNFWSL